VSKNKSKIEVGLEDKNCHHREKERKTK